MSMRHAAHRVPANHVLGKKSILPGCDLQECCPYSGFEVSFSKYDERRSPEETQKRCCFLSGIPESCPCQEPLVLVKRRENRSKDEEEKKDTDGFTFHWNLNYSRWAQKTLSLAQAALLGQKPLKTRDTYIILFGRGPLVK